ncbi:Uncharacterized protein FKW44_015597 [Caligus rogercresseyi]|uniref:Uncharacterized protein n=1 Tax=Caligus rogercresseyi TaxID=217165 RepID=A0A7T8H179_CALRO|nr:Uncharacterized protein FKW44_015597 [Caligus rogercresseyi]
MTHVFRDCKEISRLWEGMDKSFEERVGRQSTRDEKLYGFHPQSKILRTASKAIAKFQTLLHMHIL